MMIILFCNLTQHPSIHPDNSIPGQVKYQLMNQLILEHGSVTFRPFKL